MARAVTVETTGKVFERPLELLDPEGEHSHFSPHCRPDGAPNRTALLLCLPEFNSNRPGHEAKVQSSW